MVAMATFGAMWAALSATAPRLARDREGGWLAYLATTPASPTGVLVARILAALAVALPAIVAVALAAFIAHDVRRSSCGGSSSTSARSPPWTGSTSRCRPARPLRCWAPTVRARRRQIAALLGLLAPEEGWVRLFGSSPTAATRAGRTGVMLQDAELMAGVRVAELIGFIHGLYPDPTEKRLLMDLPGVSELLERRTDQLSGGQAQRVRFVLAIAGIGGGR